MNTIRHQFTQYFKLVVLHAKPEQLNSNKQRHERYLDLTIFNIGSLDSLGSLVLLSSHSNWTAINNDINNLTIFNIGRLVSLDILDIRGSLGL